jgi:hypothetical protein
LHRSLCDETGNQCCDVQAHMLLSGSCMTSKLLVRV